MNSFIETLNQRGGTFSSFAWPIFWQSSLLIVVLFAFDIFFRRKLRASIRYALWLVVLVKLCAPPTLALPTSPAWWMHNTPPTIVDRQETHYSVTSYDSAPLPEMPPMPSPVYVPPTPALTNAAWLLVATVVVSLALLVWLLVRWWQVTRQVSRAKTSDRLLELVGEAQKFAGMKSKVQVKLTANSMSPAVCGLFRPTILIPQSLAEHFSDGQLRAVLLHELIHLRRRDVWVNFLQALLQIFYWWHPLVWMANARIRRVREEAVDDAVMLALHDEAESYAPTLLEVAKLALNRPLVSLGLVGIMESRHALRQRIERLVDFRPPRKAGLTLVSLLGILAFTAVAVPMGEGPAPLVSTPAIAAQNTNTDRTTVPGILSDTNFRTVIHVLEQSNNLDSLTEPEVTTTHGRMTTLRNENRVDNISVPLTNVVAGASNQNKAINLTNGPDNLGVKSVAGKLLQDGKLIYEMGKLDEAEAKFKAALVLDPENAAAKYYLGLVQQPHQGSKISQIKSGRQDIIEKLNRIRLAEISYGDSSAGMPLREVVRDLAQKVKANDPDKQGVNFLINPNADNSGQPIASTKTGLGGFPGAGSQPQLDPITGLPAAPAAPATGGAESGDIGTTCTITIPNLKDVQLADVLDTIVRVADRPIRYSIQDFSIVFSPKGPETPLLFTRTFKVDTNTFIAGLRSIADPRKPTGLQTTNVSALARSFFSQLGVNLESPPGKVIFYGDRLGVLFVKATEDDLDTIERALQVLMDTPPPQIHIKARFFVVPKGTLDGFQYFLMSSNPADGKFIGILNKDNARIFLKTLESRPDSEILAEPEATTTSGRQTQMRATQVITVVTNYDYKTLGEIGSYAIPPLMGKFEVGPILDVVPHVLSDGYTINLTVNPSLKKFLGYYPPLPTNNVVQLPVALPTFSQQEMTANLNLWDGQTLVVGGMDERFVFVTLKDGGFPEIGRFFQSQREIAEQKKLLVFITATIVDPAGNRVHSDDELPFAQTGIPPQPAQPAQPK